MKELAEGNTELFCEQGRHGVCDLCIPRHFVSAPETAGGVVATEGEPVGERLEPRSFTNG